MTGRTQWYANDVAWHRRELQLELADEFGSSALTVMSVLNAWTREQTGDRGGQIRGGFRALMREAYTDDIDEAKAIVVRAGEIGALDELVVEEDGRRFVCRVSGYAADQERGKAAFRKQAQRDRERAAGDESQNGATQLDMSQPNVTSEDTSRTQDNTTQERELPEARANGRRTPVDHDALPDDFPQALTPVLDAVVPILERVAGAKGAIAIARAGAARTIASRPLKPHAKAASDFETYWLHGKGAKKGMRDVTASYRNWLDNESDVAPVQGSSAGRVGDKYAGMTT